MRKEGEKEFEVIFNEIISHRVFATKLRGIFDKEYKNIEEVSNFTPKISINESYKYLKKFFNL